MLSAADVGLVAASCECLLGLTWLRKLWLQLRAWMLTTVWPATTSATAISCIGVILSRKASAPSLFRSASYH
jgi:hypothetical protein